LEAKRCTQRRQLPPPPPLQLPPMQLPLLHRRQLLLRTKRNGLRTHNVPQDTSVLATRQRHATSSGGDRPRTS
jgi:hypothetical protein